MVPSQIEKAGLRSNWLGMPELRGDHLPSARASLADHCHANLFGIGRLYGTHQHSGIAENAHGGVFCNGACKGPCASALRNNVLLAEKPAIRTASHEVIGDNSLKLRSVAFGISRQPIVLQLQDLIFRFHIGVYHLPLCESAKNVGGDKQTETQSIL